MSSPVPRLPPGLQARLKPLWERLRRPLKAGFLAALATALVTLALPNQYTSEARILPADQRAGGGLGMAAAAAAAVGVMIPGQDSPDAAYVDILNSYTLRKELLETPFQFTVRTWYFGRPQARSQTLYAYLGKSNLDRAMRALKERITITRDFKTKLLTIAVQTESPELSQQVAQRLAHLLDDFVISKSQTRGGAKATFTEERLRDARSDMDRAEAAFQAFLEGNRNYLASADPAVRLRGLRLENDLKLRTQVVTTLTIAREQALLEAKNDMPILNVLDAGNLPIDKSGPARSQAVLTTWFLVSLLVLGIQERRWVLDRLAR